MTPTVAFEQLRHDGVPARGVGARPRGPRLAAGGDVLGGLALLRPPRPAHVGLLLPRHERLRRRRRGPRASAAFGSRSRGSAARSTSSRRTGTVVPAGQFQLNKNTLDVRAYDVGLAGGKLALALDLLELQGRRRPDRRGRVPRRERHRLGRGARSTSARSRARRNKLSVQYGTGVASDFRAVLTRPPGRTFAPARSSTSGASGGCASSRTWHSTASGPLSLLVGGVYQDLDNGAEPPRAGSDGRRSASARRGTSTALLVAARGGARPHPAGRRARGDALQDDAGAAADAAVGALLRPSIRTYLTWARWSDGFVGLIAPINYGEARKGFGAGVQLETWW